MIQLISSDRFCPGETRTGVQDEVYWYRFVRTLAKRLYEERQDGYSWQLCRKPLKAHCRKYNADSHVTSNAEPVVYSGGRLFGWPPIGQTMFPFGAIAFDECVPNNSRDIQLTRYPTDLRRDSPIIRKPKMDPFSLLFCVSRSIARSMDA